MAAGCTFPTVVIILFFFVFHAQLNREIRTTVAKLSTVVNDDCGAATKRFFFSMDDFFFLGMIRSFYCIFHGREDLVHPLKRIWGERKVSHTRTRAGSGNFST